MLVATLSQCIVFVGNGWKVSAQTQSQTSISNIERRTQAAAGEIANPETQRAETTSRRRVAQRDLASMATPHSSHSPVSSYLGEWRQRVARPSAPAFTPAADHVRTSPSSAGAPYEYELTSAERELAVAAQSFPAAPWPTAHVSAERELEASALLPAAPWSAAHVPRPSSAEPSAQGHGLSADLELHLARARAAAHKAAAAAVGARVPPIEALPTGRPITPSGASPQSADSGSGTAHMHLGNLETVISGIGDELSKAHTSQRPPPPPVGEVDRYLADRVDYIKRHSPMRAEAAPAAALTGGGGSTDTRGLLTSFGVEVAGVLQGARLWDARAPAAPPSVTGVAGLRGAGSTDKHEARGGGGTAFTAASVPLVQYVVTPPYGSDGDSGPVDVPGHFAEVQVRLLETPGLRVVSTCALPLPNGSCKLLTTLTLR